MPNQHKAKGLSWHPTSAEDSAWVRAEAERRGGRTKGALARLLDEALADLRAKHEQTEKDDLILHAHPDPGDDEPHVHLHTGPGHGGIGHSHPHRHAEGEGG